MREALPVLDFLALTWSDASTGAAAIAPEASVEIRELRPVSVSPDVACYLDSVTSRRLRFPVKGLKPSFSVRPGSKRLVISCYSAVRSK